MSIPLFKSHYSIGKSILTLKPPAKVQKGGADSIIDIALDAGETLYGEVDSANITSNLGDSYFSSRLNVLEYSLSDDKII